MGKAKSPASPMLAHHRLLKTLVPLAKGGDKMEPRPEELDRVARVFMKAGGSWEGVFEGSIDEMMLLRRVVKVAVQRGVFTKKPQWSA